MNYMFDFLCCLPCCPLLGQRNRAVPHPFVLASYAMRSSCFNRGTSDMLNTFEKIPLFMKAGILSELKLAKDSIDKLKLGPACYGRGPSHGYKHTIL